MSDANDTERQQLADLLWRRERWVCVSSLVATLAEGFPHRQKQSDTEQALSRLCEQALALAAPVDDWREAAIQAGLKLYRERGKIRGPEQADDQEDSMVGNYESWEEACRENDIEPYEREVLEHWIVSRWLADKLIAKSEKVDKDFAGLCVWARTTSGQSIALDAVIEQIALDLWATPEDRARVLAQR